MKRFKVSIDNGNYLEFSEIPLCVREFIENCGCESGVIDLPSVRYEFSVCPEQYFPEDMIDTIHRITAELRMMSETIETEIDAVQFRQTIAVLRSSASRLTAAVKKEHERNQVLNGDRLELIDENPNLCLFHRTHDRTYNPQYLNPDCPVCEREIDRMNNDCPNCRDY